MSAGRVEKKAEKKVESVNDVRCTRCKAPAGEGCMTPSGNPANEPHAARVNAFWAVFVPST